jgi:hypothetical protein
MNDEFQMTNGAAIVKQAVDDSGSTTVRAPAARGPSWTGRTGRTRRDRQAHRQINSNEFKPFQMISNEFKALLKKL